MIFRKYNEKNAEKVVELLNICFPKQNISEKSFLWKHFDDYFGNKSVGYVAEDNESLCFFVCFTPIGISFREDVRKFYSCSVQATHPKYRRQGIVTRLTKMVEEEIDKEVEYIGFSNGAGVKIDKYSKNINYEIIGRMATRYVLSAPRKTSIKIKRISKVNFQDNFQPYFSIHKNSHYINWRYEKNPKYEYEYFAIQKYAQNIGYIICKKNAIKYEVQELLFANFDLENYRQTIKAFSRFALLDLSPN